MDYLQHYLHRFTHLHTAVNRTRRMFRSSQETRF